MDHDRCRVALGRVLERDGLQYRILEARVISRRQAIDLDVIEAALEDLGGLRHCVTYGAESENCGQWYQGMPQVLENKPSDRSGHGSGG
ncbi:hypothetical protein ACM26W_01830 [Halomonas sp. HK25]|uniref:hypothetical protein n=1 Tax=Halomonas sp. HK25 TaxID=3394321 RepID=UPI0039FDB622